MEPLSEAEIRASFVNCSKGEARRLATPRDLATLAWDDLDYLGWRDPGAPDRGYLVTRSQDRLIGLTMRSASAKRRSLVKTNICSICVTPHTSGGVDLLVAPKAGVAGRDGNTVGVYMCADLMCSLYVRGKRTSMLGSRLEETLSLAEQIDRTRANLAGFVAKVFDVA